MNFKKFFKEALVGLEYHKTLNPAIWDTNDHLKPDVRFKLLAFAKAFQQFGHVPDAAVRDIWIVGGNAAYNYTKYSDIDVHVIIDKPQLGSGILVDQYLRSIKLLWSAKHNIKVRDYNIEPYFQDQHEPIASAGIYSIKSQTWIRKPTQDACDSCLNNPETEKKVKHYQDLIDHMISQNHSLDAFNQLKKKIADLRKEGLAAGGEFSEGNLIFKSLRNSGYLDRLSTHISQQFDKDLSL